MEKTDEQLLKDAQYRKGLSIAFFNATNAAIALVSERQIPDRKEALDEVVRTRDFFLEEHKTYYANVIANVGLFDPKETMVKLQATKTLEELKLAWIRLSEDERQNEEVQKVKKELKDKYEQK